MARGSFHLAKLAVYANVRTVFVVFIWYLYAKLIAVDGKRSRSVAPICGTRYNIQHELIILALPKDK